MLQRLVNAVAAHLLLALRDFRPGMSVVDIQVPDEAENDADSNQMFDENEQANIQELFEDEEVQPKKDDSKAA